jgi:hypothetical protein
MKQVKHSKFKNTGIVFDILSRMFVSETLNNRRTQSVSIIRKHFKKDSELLKELKLYQSIQEKGLEESTADNLIKITQDLYKKIDKGKLLKEKYNLIGDIKKHYDISDFFKVRVPNYTALASFYNVLQPDSSDPLIYAKSRTKLLESLITPKEQIQEQDVELFWRNQPKDVRELGFHIMVEKFDQKYGSLNGKQREFLRKYINEDTTSTEFRDFFYSEVLYCKNKINMLSENNSDAVLSIKMKEVVNLLEEVVSSKKIKDNQISALLNCYELLGE